MTFWSDEKWSSSSGEQCVEPYNPDAQKEASYLLSIGDEVYISSPEARSKKQILTDKKPSFSIEPGQFAFLLSAERVTTPFDTIGFISIRAKIKFMGLVNISGFHVDPGYSGKLIFAVFNAGPTRIHLQKGQPIFPLWLATLDKPIKRTEIKEGYTDIPPELITQISGNFTTAYQVKTQLDAIRADVMDLKAFKLYLTAILTAVGIILFPIIKDRLDSVLSIKPTTQSQPPATSEPSAAPNSSQKKTQ
jgi:dCTP deaminase